MKPYQDKFSHLINNTLENECFTHVYLSSCLGASKKKTLVALFQCYGTARYGSVRFTFGGFPLGTVPGTWYFSSTTSAGVPSDPYRYQNVACKLY